MATMTLAEATRDFLTKMYLAAFLRAPDIEGLNYWSEDILVKGKSFDEVGASIFNVDAVKVLYPVSMTDSQFVEAIYKNVFNRSSIPSGALDYWVNELADLRDASTADLAFFEARGKLVSNMINAGLDTPNGTPGKLYIENRLTVASDAIDQQFAANKSLAQSDLAAVMSTVTENPATVVAAHDVIAQLIVGTKDFNLSLGKDVLVGNALDNEFYADLSQADMFGNVSNTFESGDQLFGEGGRDQLHVSLAPTVIGTVPVGPVIQAVTTGIEEVYMEAQFPNVLDTTIDAGRMVGVEQWWSDNSRSSIIVEDIRSETKDTTFGMTNTDPVNFVVGAPVLSSASFYAAFDPSKVSKETTPTNSSLNLVIEDLVTPALQLQNVPIDGLKFKFNGVDYVVRSQAMADADTYAEFVTALNAALDANPALVGLNTVLNADNSMTITDPLGGTFVKGEYTFLNDSIPVPLFIFADQAVGDATDVAKIYETNIVLDDVGRTSQGGEMIIGSMAEGGVDVFNVKVDGSSWLSGLSSKSYLDGFSTAIPLPMGSRDVLDTVNVEHYNLGSQSSLSIGETRVDPTTGFSNTDDNRLSTNGFLSASLFNPGGLQDVREFNAAGFQGDIKLAADITGFSVIKYLDPATGPVDFKYTMGEKNDNMSISISNAVATDPDYNMDIKMGAGDDRLNYDGGGENAKVSVDGGTGKNTIEVRDVNSDAFNSFKNFEKLIVAGDTDTTQNMAHYPGIKDLVIATNAPFGADGISTTVDNLAANTSITISGMNQTLSNGNNNANQFFNDITLNNALNPDLLITLDNTARISGKLTVDDLNIQVATSAVRKLTIDSTGDRDTTNQISAINAPLVNTFVFKGTQALTIGDGVFGTGSDNNGIFAAANHTAAPALVQDFTVDASGLAKATSIEINAAIINNVDAAGKKVTITGTAATTDTLILNASNADTTTVTSNTTISGFETIVIGDFNGGPGTLRWDDSNVSGVKVYELLDSDGTIAASEGVIMSNMEAQATIRFTYDDVFNGDVQIDASSRAPGSVLTFDYAVADNLGASWIGSNDYETVKIVDSTNISVAFRDIDLFLVGYEDPVGTNKANFAKTLVIEGGFNNAGSTLENDSVLNMEGNGTETSGLNASLNWIDLSAYKGDFVGRFQVSQDETGAADATLNTNTVIKVNDQDFTFNMNMFDGNIAMARDVATDKITTFKFTKDAADTQSDWVITGFHAFNDGFPTTLNDVSVLDMRDLGVTGLAGLVFTDLGGDVRITSSTGKNFDITLVGIADIAHLTNENFQFAV